MKVTMICRLQTAASALTHRLLSHSVKLPLRILLLWFTADHGGHDRTHGTDSPEDMTIPFIIKGKNFKVGEKP